MSSGVASDSLFTVPSKENIEKAVESYEPIEREYVDDPDNLAGSEQLVGKHYSTVATYYSKFIGQAGRKELETYLKDADAKWRMASDSSRQYKADSSQKQNTLSKVASEQFYNSIKLKHAGLISITFGDGEEKPARYEPVERSKDYVPEEGKRVAEEQTAYFNAIYDTENWEQAIKESMLWALKNGQEVISVQWQYKTKTCTERVPGYYTADAEPVEVKPGDPRPESMYDKDGDPIDAVFDTDGRPLSYVFVEKTRIIKNHPVFLRYPLERCYFDLDINADSIDDEIQKQSCIILRDQVTFDYLLSKQKDGEYMNVENLTAAQLYDGTDEEGETIDENRYRNANETSGKDRIRNGLFRKYHVYMLAPIDYKSKKWDAEQVPTLTEAVYIGRLSGDKTAAQKDADEKNAPQGAVCVMLRKIPFNHRRFPLKLIHSLQDDKEGAIHLGYYNLLECNIEEQITTLNQHIDNKTLKIKTPFVAERGNVLTRDLLFKNGNQALWVKPGTGQTALTQLKIEDMTATTIPLMEFLKNQADETIGTTDVIKGAFAGSRTTGTEVLSVREQALQPAIEHAKYVDGQYFEYILRDVADLSRQYADPTQPTVVGGAEDAGISIVNPAELYGELKVKVTSIEKFKADLTAKQALIQFIQVGGYDRAQQFMQETGALHFWRTVGQFLKIPDVFKIFPAAKRMVEAENQAWLDVNAILQNPEDAVTNEALLPKPDERHDIHLGILKSQRKRYQIIAGATEDGVNQAILAAFDLYIQMHEDFQAQEQVEAQTLPQPEGVGSPSTMSGENFGDQLSGTISQAAPEAM